MKEVGLVHIVVNSFQNIGGYSLLGMYLPQDGSKFPIAKLNGNKKKEVKSVMDIRNVYIIFAKRIYEIRNCK